MLAAEADGTTIETVEGLARDVPDGGLTVLQQSFLDTGAAQCGFCIPGQLMSAQALLALTPHPTRAEIEEGLAGNLCRCAGYEQIFEAVERAAVDGADGTAARNEPPGPAQPTVDVASVPDARMAPQ
jgi:carbon-monoxide dehydrogenase small subunit